MALAGFDGDFVWTDDPTTCGCEGDSGGPMLLAIGGTETVIGVDIWVTNPSSCTGQLVAARTDVHAGFVDPFIEANDPGFLHPQQDAAVPPQDAAPVDGAGPGDAAAGDASAADASPADGRPDRGRDAGTDDVGGGCASARGAPAGVLLALVPLALVAARRRPRGGRAHGRRLV
jgi:hypothetical protein